MAKSSVLSTPRLEEFKKKKNRALRVRVILFFILIVSILIGLSYLSRSPKFNIDTVEISGNKIVDEGLMKEIIDQRLEEYYLWVIPKTNFLVYPKNSIKEILFRKFKRLDTISLSIKNVKTLEVAVTEREPKYLWCSEISDKGPTCYFLDKAGYAFDLAPYFSGSVYLKFYGGDDPGLTDPLGTYFFPQIFKNLITFKTTMEEIGLKPVAFSLTNSGDVEMMLSGNNAKIFFKQEDDFAKLAENLQTALQTEPLQSEFKTKYPFLSYIDLRFDDKVLYKFQ